MEEVKSKLVCVIGAPSSGKSTLAASVHHGLKITKRNSIFVGVSIFFNDLFPTPISLKLKTIESTKKTPNT